jgi:hypothetical protein
VCLRLTIVSNNDSIEVLDHTKTIATKGEIVGTITSTSVTKVEGLLAVEGRASISIRNSHLADAHAVHDAPSIIANIVEDGTLARIEGDAKAPLLPLDERLICDFERGSFRLSDIDRLDVFADSAFDELRDVLCWLAMIENARCVSLASQTIPLSPCCQAIEADNFLFMSIHDRDEGERISIKVGVRITVAGVLGETQALEISAVFCAKVKTTVRPVAGQYFILRHCYC